MRLLWLGAVFDLNSSCSELERQRYADVHRRELLLNLVLAQSLIH